MKAPCTYFALQRIKIMSIRKNQIFGFTNKSPKTDDDKLSEFPICLWILLSTLWFLVKVCALILPTSKRKNTHTYTHPHSSMNILVLSISFASSQFGFHCTYHSLLLFLFIITFRYLFYSFSLNRKRRHFDACTAMNTTIFFTCIT